MDNAQSNGTGRVFKYGRDIDTDVIIPARHLNSFDPAGLASHCMEDIDKDFAGNVKNGDFIVALENFGCGSSREHAPLAIKHAGIGCVIAASFARIFYRNAINIGLPIMECPEAARDIAAGDSISVDYGRGIIVNHSRNKSYQARAFPDFMALLIRSGGLIEYTKSRLAGAEAQA